MIKLLTLWLLFLVPVASAQRTPSTESGLEESLELRLIKNLGRYVLMTEAKIRQELTDETYSQVLLGGYYRISKRWRLGLFGQAEQGLRWDDDWGKKTGDANWSWQSSQGRWDYSSVADSTFADHLTPKLLYEIKTRLFYYHSRDALQLRLRPALRYFILQEGQPIWQIFTAIEAYAPLNYGEGPLYEYWLYLGALYQVTPNLSLGPIVSFRQRWFRSYENFEDRTGDDFEKTFTSTNVGLAAIYSW